MADGDDEPRGGQAAQQKEKEKQNDPVGDEEMPVPSSSFSILSESSSDEERAPNLNGDSPKATEVETPSETPASPSQGHAFGSTLSDVGPTARRVVSFVSNPTALFLAATASRAIVSSSSSESESGSMSSSKQQEHVKFAEQGVVIPSSSCEEEHHPSVSFQQQQQANNNEKRDANRLRGGSLVDELLFQHHDEDDDDDNTLEQNNNNGNNDDPNDADEQSNRSHSSHAACSINSRQSRKNNQKVVTIRVGQTLRKIRSMTGSIVDDDKKNRQTVPATSSWNLHNSAGLWIIIWVINNLSITLIDKIAFNEPIDFKYPYFLSAHHMAFISIGTNFIFWCLERHEIRYSAVAGQQDDESSQVVGDVEENRSRGSKQVKIEKQAPLGQQSFLSTTAVKGPPSSSKQGKERQEEEASATSSNRSLPKNWITTLFGDLQKKELDAKGKRTILLYSLIFSSNLCIGNVSIRYVSINFNQVMRSLVPAVTIAMGFMIGKPTSCQRQLAVVPVIAGVAMACLGDMSYTPIGFVYTSLCVFLAALKVVASGEIMTGDSGLKLHPFDLLRHMTPLALVQCLIMSWVTGEIPEIVQRWPEDFNPLGPKGWYPFLVVNLTGVISLTFNVSSLQVNKLTSPLTLCVAANVKQVLMIIIATIIFNTEITPLNAFGIVVVLIGSAWYSYISAREKEEKKKMKKLAKLQNKNDAKDIESADPLRPRVTILPKKKQLRILERYLSASSSSESSHLSALIFHPRRHHPAARLSQRSDTGTWSRYAKSCLRKATNTRYLLCAGLFAASWIVGLHFSKAHIHHKRES